MTPFLTLIRLPNLLIIAATQYLMRYAVIQPMLALSDIELQLSHLDFFLLSLSSVFIAAAGYVINDYFDTKIDQINRPKTVVVGVSIKRRIAMGAHIVLTILGILLGFYIGYKAGFIKLGIIHFIAAGILWFYSTDFKNQSFTGNFLIALLSGMIPLVVLLFELPLLNYAYKDILIETGLNFNFLFKFIGGFAIFSFLLTLLREIIKDMEDLKGDEAFGLRTLPVTFGINKAKKIAFFIILLTIISIGIVQYFQLTNGDTLSFSYMLAAVQLPLLYLAFRLKGAETPVEYNAAGMLTKLIMVIGLLYAALIYVVLTDFNLNETIKF
jgi:4-hydroxybenzoate polyprenyltransferase